MSYSSYPLSEILKEIFFPINVKLEDKGWYQNEFGDWCDGHLYFGVTKRKAMQVAGISPSPLHHRKNHCRTLKELLMKNVESFREYLRVRL